MKKEEIIAFFDRYAPQWDSHLVTDEEKINCILDSAGIRKGCKVLDVACGTGVLFPWYLRREASRVIGVDISPEMAALAQKKAQDTIIQVLCGDIQTMPVMEQVDCCVVYNAFPHFLEPEAVIESLARWVRPGGRLTVAHSMSLDALHAHHAGSAAAVSREMVTPEVLSAMFSPWFQVETALSDDEKYIVTGIRAEE